MRKGSMMTLRDTRTMEWGDLSACSLREINNELMIDEHFAAFCDDVLTVLNPLKGALYRGLAVYVVAVAKLA